MCTLVELPLVLKSNTMPKITVCFEDVPVNYIYFEWSNSSLVNTCQTHLGSEKRLLQMDKL